MYTYGTIVVTAIVSATINVSATCCRDWFTGRYDGRAAVCSPYYCLLGKASVSRFISTGDARIGRPYVLQPDQLTDAL